MILFTRHAVIAPGRLADALQFAVRVADHVSSTVSGVKVTAGIGVGGRAGLVSWTSEYADLAALEQAQAQLFADPTYLALVNEAADLFLPGSVEDQIVKTL